MVFSSILSLWDIQPLVPSIQAVSGLGLISWHRSQVGQLIVGHYHKFSPPLPHYILQARQILGQRFFGWVDVLVTLTEALPVYIRWQVQAPYPCYWDASVSYSCRFQVGFISLAFYITAQMPPFQVSFLVLFPSIPPSLPDSLCSQPPQSTCKNYSTFPSQRDPWIPQPTLLLNLSGSVNCNMIIFSIFSYSTQEH